MTSPRHPENMSRHRPDPGQNWFMAPHPHILELFKGDADELVSSISLQFTQNLVMQAAPGTTAHFTLGGHHAQYSGYKQSTISIVGRSGDRQIDIVRFRKMRNFLEEVEKLRAEHENAFYLNEHYKLVVSFPWEMERHYCYVQSFAWQRASGNNTFSFNYSLNLVTYAPADSVQVRPPFVDTDQPTTGVTPEQSARLAAFVKGIGGRIRPRRDLDAEAERSGRQSVEEGAPTGPVILDQDGEPVVPTDQQLNTSPNTSNYKVKDGPDDTAGKEGATDAILEGTDKSGGIFSAAHAKNHRDLDADIQGAKAQGLVLEPFSGPDKQSTAFKVIGDVARPGADKKGGNDNFFTSALSVLSTAERCWRTLWFDYIALPLNEANRLRNTVVPFLNFYRSIATTVRTVVGRYYRVVPEWKAWAAWVKNDFNNSTRILRTAFREIEEMGSLAYWRRQFGHGEMPMAPILTNNYQQPVVAVRVESGDNSAFDVAGRVIGSRASWQTIRVLNNMRDPFSYADGSPLRAGNTILVPSPATLTPSDTGSLFGSDFMIADGDIVLDSGGGYAIVTGQDNVAQSINHRLRTVRGSNRAFPRFGLQKYLSEQQTSTLYGQVWSDMNTQVSRDRRISRVAKLALTEGPTSYKADLEYDLLSLGKQQLSIEHTTGS